MRLKDIGEFGFIDRIKASGDIRSAGVVKGIGDDCAVIAIGGPDHLLVTTDLLVERVHFHLEWGTPEQLGAKALAVNLSDIAACGGEPRDAFVSLAIPDYISVDWLDGFYRGLTRLSREYGVNVLGGDTTGSKGHLVINVALTGLVPKDQVLYRYTARAGDVIALTGPTGASAAGCDILLSRGDPLDDTDRGLIRCHLEPRAHLREAGLLSRSGACTAAIDVSDGLSSDLGHICEESGLGGAVIFEERIPLADGLIIAGNRMGKDPLRWVLHGGEDYVLLVALDQSRLPDLLQLAANHAFSLTPIGHFRQDPGIELVRRDGSSEPLLPRGWNHFR